MAKKSLSELKAILDAEKSDALASFNASTLSDERSKALDYYRGDMSSDMPSLPDRSMERLVRASEREAGDGVVQAQ